MCRKPVVPHWDRSGIHLFYSTLLLLYSIFCEVNTRSRKLHTLDYCRLSTLALLLVDKVDLLPDHIQNYSKSEKMKEYMCTFFQTLSVCIHVINNVNFMDNLWYRDGCHIRYKRQVILKD